MGKKCSHSFVVKEVHNKNVKVCSKCGLMPDILSDFFYVKKD